MHNRKRFIVYPPNYIPGKTSWISTFSKGKAKKVAKKLGFGAEIHEDVRTHPRPFSNWISNRTPNIWDYHE